MGALNKQQLFGKLTEVVDKAASALESKRGSGNKARIDYARFDDGSPKPPDSVIRVSAGLGRPGVGIPIEGVRHDVGMLLLTIQWGAGEWTSILNFEVEVLGADGQPLGNAESDTKLVWATKSPVNILSEEAVEVVKAGLNVFVKKHRIKPTIYVRQLNADGSGNITGCIVEKRLRGHGIPTIVDEAPQRVDLNTLRKMADREGLEIADIDILDNGKFEFKPRGNHVPTVLDVSAVTSGCVDNRAPVNVQETLDTVKRELIEAASSVWGQPYHERYVEFLEWNEGTPQHVFEWFLDGMRFVRHVYCIHLVYSSRFEEGLTEPPLNMLPNHVTVQLNEELMSRYPSAKDSGPLAGTLVEANLVGPFGTKLTRDITSNVIKQFMSRVKVAWDGGEFAIATGAPRKTEARTPVRNASQAVKDTRVAGVKDTKAAGKSVQDVVGTSKKATHVCIQRERDRQGRIMAYVLQNVKTQGTVRVSAEELKQKIRSKAVVISNLTLTSDGRLLVTL